MTDYEIEAACRHLIRKWEQVMQGAKPYDRPSQMNGWADEAVVLLTKVELVLGLRAVRNTPLKDLL